MACKFQTINGTRGFQQQRNLVGTSSSLSSSAVCPRSINPSPRKQSRLHHEPTTTCITNISHSVRTQALSGVTIPELWQQAPPPQSSSSSGHLLAPAPALEQPLYLGKRAVISGAGPCGARLVHACRVSVYLILRMHALTEQ
jgi:hypothetical protein